MSLNFKEKELAYIGASIAAGCKPCTNYHFKKAQVAGATEAEIKQAISDAVYVRDSAKTIMENHASKLLGNQVNNEDCGCTDNTSRIKELVSIAAAFAINCKSNLEKHISLGKKIGITNIEISKILDTTLLIKNKAASYLNEIAGKIRTAEQGESKEEMIYIVKESRADEKGLEKGERQREDVNCGCE